MSNTNDTNVEKIRPLAYVIAGLSFIPALGVAFGIAAIVWGLVTDKIGGKKVAALGTGGIAFTIAIYGALFYFAVGQRGGIYDDLRAKLTQSTINSLVPAIEFYKIQYGKYPESLEVLRASMPKDSFIIVFDPSASGFGVQPRPFFYQRVGDDHYYLRGVGADGVPFTDDDVVPQAAMPAGGKVGLLLERVSQ